MDIANVTLRGSYIKLGIFAQKKISVYSSDTQYGTPTVRMTTRRHVPAGGQKLAGARQQLSQLEEATNNEQLFFVGNTHITH